MRSRLPDASDPSVAFDDLGPLGEGGMGEVRRVRDPVLDRTLAVKRLRRHLAAREDLVARFVDEAKLTARLQHPGIVPVHALGLDADGTPWFTMREVLGRTLADAIRAVHQASGAEGWRPAPSGLSLYRLVEALRRACDAVAFAHAKGVLHLDLKPENVILGDFGEVVVLDWGLARKRAEAGTRQVAGTPAFMAPEQARAEPHRIDERTDVYGLGCVLYQVLAGRPPYEGDPLDVLERVRTGPPPLPRPAPGEPRPDPPADLVACCSRAMARLRDDRHPDVAALSADIEGWLDGSRRVDRGREVLAEAEAAWLRAESLHRESEALEAHGRGALARVRPCEPEDAKVEAWSALDAAEALATEAQHVEAERAHLLQAALRHAPDLADAHVALAEIHRAAHAAAEGAGETSQAKLAEVRLREQIAHLPAFHPRRRAHEAWLDGAGALTLLTDPPGAMVELARYVPFRRRLVPGEVRVLGVTPLVEVPVAMGTYLCTLRHPDREPVRYPVSIGRQEHWHGVPPGAREPVAVPLPPTGSLGPDEVYVPAGWFAAGGDVAGGSGLPRAQRWVDGLVVDRFPVRHRDYLRFLNDRVRQGRSREALAAAPRWRGTGVEAAGAHCYGRRLGRFEIGRDPSGIVWDLDWPVFLVDWWGATTFASWRAERTGVAWRLPGELEREKAARGVDGRRYPWGDRFDPSWCCMRESHAGAPQPERVGTRPVDESPYGVRDVAGGIRDWCAEPWREEGPLCERGRVLPPAAQAPPEGELRQLRTTRGGCWDGTERICRTTERGRNPIGTRDALLGFRCVRPWPA